METEKYSGSLVWKILLISDLTLIFKKEGPNEKEFQTMSFPSQSMNKIFKGTEELKFFSLFVLIFTLSSLLKYFLSIDYLPGPDEDLLQRSYGSFWTRNFLSPQSFFFIRLIFVIHIAFEISHNKYHKKPWC